MICDIPVFFQKWNSLSNLIHTLHVTNNPLLSYQPIRKYFTSACSHLGRNTCSYYIQKHTYQDHYVKYILFSFYQDHFASAILRVSRQCLDVGRPYLEVSTCLMSRCVYTMTRHVCTMSRHIPLHSLGHNNHNEVKHGFSVM